MDKSDRADPDPQSSVVVPPSPPQEARETAILFAPCAFCGYNGAGYWQSGTHAESCPWRNIGGEDARSEALRTTLRSQTAALDQVRKERDERTRFICEVVDEADVEEAMEQIAHDYKSWHEAMETIRHQESWEPNAYPSFNDRLIFRALKDRSETAEREREELKVDVWKLLGARDELSVSWRQMADTADFWAARALKAEALLTSREAALRAVRDKWRDRATPNSFSGERLRQCADELDVLLGNTAGDDA